MPQDSDDLVYIGIKGSVVAIERASGKIRWTAQLAGAGFVNLQRDQNLVLATTKGQVFCLDAASGTVLWTNGLAGFGYGIATIAAGDSSQNAAAIAEQLRQEEQEATVTAASA